MTTLHRATSDEQEREFLEKGTVRLLQDADSRLLVIALDRLGDRADRKRLVEVVLKALLDENFDADAGGLESRLRGLRRLQLIEFVGDDVQLTALGRRLAKRFD